MLRRSLTTAATLVVAAVVFGAPSARAAGLPTIVDTWARSAASTSAELKGIVNPNGSPTLIRIEYVTRARYDANLGTTPPQPPFTGGSYEPAAGFPLGSGLLGTFEEDVEFTRPLSGLAAGAGYRYRIVATNGFGTVEGPTKGFATIAAGSGGALPDNRAWEMVSPLDKGGGEIQGPGDVFGGGLIQAAPGGGAVTYTSDASFGATPGAPGASQYVSVRSAGGWATRNVTQAGYGGGYGPAPDGVPFQLFDPGLGKALMALPWGCEAAPCPRRFALLDTGSGAVASSPAQPDLAAPGAGADLGTVVLSTCAKLTPVAVEVPAGSGCDPAAANLYAWSAGGLSSINLLPGAGVSAPGAALASSADAVSADGSRVYFAQGGNLYLRAGGETVQVDAAAGGGAVFETASRDGALAYYTAAGHLYRFSAAGGTSEDLTPAGGVLGVLGTSADGVHTYFQSAAGLRYVQGSSVTAVDIDADPVNYPPATGGARVGVNGNLAFVADVEWPGADNADNAQVFLYSPAADALECLSCNPTGIRSKGPARIAPPTRNGVGPSASSSYRPRALTDAGTRLYFESPDPLVLGDTNNARDVYQWEARGVGSCTRPGGCVALISSGRAIGGSRFLDASADGNEVYFLTGESLVKADPDAADVYVARVGGGFPDPSVPIPCLGDACQPIPSPPADPVVGTTLIRPETNPPLRFVRDKNDNAKKKKRKAGKDKKGKSRKGKSKRGKRDSRSAKPDAGGRR
ncbi:MAG TPA: hypothetical protein VEW07_10165 [Solirubrobacterales bacterium]|nr:hypothetical protein [Solirubrobacterales bacterium]